MTSVRMSATKFLVAAVLLVAAIAVAVAVRHEPEDGSVRAAATPESAGRRDPPRAGRALPEVSQLVPAAKNDGPVAQEHGGSAGGADATPIPVSTIRVQVVDAPTGDPIGDAQVAIHSLGGGQRDAPVNAVTDAKGMALLRRALDRPDLVLTVSSPGWMPAQFDLPVGSEGDVHRCVLTRAWDVLLIVRGPEGQTFPEEEIGIDASCTGNPQERGVPHPPGTILLGPFSWTRTPPDRVTLRVNHRDYVAVVLNGFADRLDVRRRAEVLVQFGAPASISGPEGQAGASTVGAAGGAALAGAARDADGHPAANVSIYLWPKSSAGADGPQVASTDVQGRFVFQGLAAGDYRLWAQGDELLLDAVRDETLGAEERREIALALSRGGVLEGVVINAQNFAGAGSQVMITDQAPSPFPGGRPYFRMRMTDAQGRFRVGGLFLDHAYSISTYYGQIAVAVEVLSAAPDRMEVRCRVVGRAKDSPPDAPLRFPR